LTLVNITIFAQLSKVPHVNFLALLLVIHIDEGWEWAGKAAGQHVMSPCQMKKASFSAGQISIWKCA
jgi:hypothetical protein